MLPYGLSARTRQTFASDDLNRQRVPMIFTTGYDSSALPPRLRRLPCLQKPIDALDLVRKIGAQIAAHRKWPPLR